MRKSGDSSGDEKEGREESWCDGKEEKEKPPNPKIESSMTRLQVNPRK